MTRMRALSALPVSLVLLMACGTPPNSDLNPVTDLRAGIDPDLVDEIEQVSATFEAELADAYALPRSGSCPNLGSYGQMLEDNLMAVALADDKLAATRLAQAHAYLGCVSAKEFVLIRDALDEVLLRHAEDKGQPILREIDALAVPLVVLLHDMGARELGSDLAAWLVLRAPAISATIADPNSGLASAGLFVAHGPTLRRVTPGERDRLINSLETGTFVGSCALAESIAPNNDWPLCPRDCDWLPPNPAFDAQAHAELVALCEAYDELTQPGESPLVLSGIHECLDDYRAAISKDDVGMCLRTGLGALSKDFGLEGSNQARVSKRCQLSQGQPKTKEETAEWLAKLERRRAKLNKLAQKIEATQEATDIDLVAEALEVARIKVLDEMSEIDDEINDIKNGGGGTHRCAMDSEACPSNCDIESAALELTNSCLEQSLDPFAPTDPDPIDPVDPQVDPDSPLGKLSSCIAGTVSKHGDGDQDDCAAVLTCADQQIAVEHDGMCVCDVERMDVPLDTNCDWYINCAPDQLCTCEGVPMGGNPIPQPPPEFDVVHFRG